MKKNTHITVDSNFILKTISGFQVLCVAFLTSIRTLLGLILELFKSDTKKLPIVYANIRV